MKRNLLLKILFIILTVLLFLVIAIKFYNNSNINKEKNNTTIEQSIVKKIGYNIINDSLGLKTTDVNIESIDGHNVKFFNKKDSTNTSKIYIDVNTKNKSYIINTKRSIKIGTEEDK